MRRATTCLLACTVVSFAGVQGQDVSHDSWRAVDGSTVLVHSLEVPASVDEAWAAFTTAEGLTSWAVPFAVVDFRVGGVWESSYAPDARPGDPGNIRSRYLSFVPRRMISLQAVDAPPDFPHPEVLPDLFSVIELDSVAADRTRVTMYGVGYADTPAHDAVRAMFRDANAWSLRMLHRRFVEGPVDWESAPSFGSSR